MWYLLALFIGGAAVLVGTKAVAGSFLPPKFKINDVVKVPASLVGGISGFVGTVVGITRGPVNMYAIGPLGSTNPITALAVVKESDLTAAQAS